MERSELNIGKVYKSLYGEQNPDRKSEDHIDFSYMLVKHDESGVRRGISWGSMGGSTLTLRATERI